MHFDGDALLMPANPARFIKPTVHAGARRSSTINLAGIVRLHGSFNGITKNHTEADWRAQ
jgi:hypothetical protein